VGSRLKLFRKNLPKTSINYSKFQKEAFPVELFQENPIRRKLDPHHSTKKKNRNFNHHSIFMTENPINKMTLGKAQ
jgi:hypothetical protein